MKIEVSKRQKYLLLDDLKSTWKFYDLNLKVGFVPDKVEREEMIKNVRAVEDLLIQLGAKVPT